VVSIPFGGVISFPHDIRLTSLTGIVEINFFVERRHSFSILSYEGVNTPVVTGENRYNMFI